MALHRICLLSCDEVVASLGGASAVYGESACDDDLLHASLAARRIAFDVRSWTDPLVDWSHYVMCVVRTAWDYSLSEARSAEFVKFLDSLEASGVRVLNGTHIIRWNASKAYLFELEKCGISIIPSVVVHPHMLSTSTLASLLLSSPTQHAWPAGCDVFIKPLVGGSSRACLRTRPGDAASMAAGEAFLSEMLARGCSCPASEGMATAVSTTTPCRCGTDGVGCSVLVQPFIEGVARGELSVVVIDGAVTHAVEKVPAAGDFRCQSEHGAIVRRAVCSGEASDSALRAVAIARGVCTRRLSLPAHQHDRDCCDVLFARVDFLRMTDDDGAEHLLLLELELIEPTLYLAQSQAGDAARTATAAEALAEAISARLQCM